MEIRGSIPFHVAQAYGVRAPVRAINVAKPQAASALTLTDQASSAAPASGIRRSPLLDRIVAATVHRPIEFDGAATVSPSASLQLYTRAADKVEAAVAVNVGRAIDLSA